jgi:hypothetical protein
MFFPYLSFKLMMHLMFWQQKPYLKLVLIFFLRKGSIASIFSQSNFLLVHSL